MIATAESLPARPALRRLLPVAFAAGLLALSLTPRIGAIPALARSFWGACAALALWYAWLLVRAGARRLAFAIEVQIIRVHWVQMCVHSSIYTYWGTAWPFIYGQIPLILGQICFAYAFGILLSWTRGDRYRLGFGPVPIMLSTNLFLTFKDEWFYLQFAMIAVGMLGKELIRWQKNGQSAHIFNPSAFSLFIFSIALILTHNTGLTWGNEIAVNLEMPPYIYFVIFGLGLLVQSLFRVTLVTLGAAAALYALGTGYTAATGTYWFLDSGIPIAVFLGLHLLVTDPATSPRSDLGRFLFGVGYGAGVFALYGLLEWAGAPRFYDKLLCVPLLNLTVQAIDRSIGGARWASAITPGWLERLDAGRRNVVYMGIWILLFAWMTGTHFFGDGFPGRSTAFWQQACVAGLRNGCRDIAQIRGDECTDGQVAGCRALADGLTEHRYPAHDPLELTRTLARGCDLGDGPLCSRLGEALTPAERDALEASCSNRTGQSCYVLGSVHLIGIGTGADRVRAFGYFRRACDLGVSTGCNVMADMYRYGVGTTKSPSLAFDGHDRACRRGVAPSCKTLAEMSSAGEGTARDERRAAAMYERACLLGLASTCSH